MPFTVQDFPLVAIGGIPPYTFSTIDDVRNTFFAVGGADSVLILAGVPNLHLDATAVSPGVYKTHVRVTDSTTPVPNTADSLITVVADDPSILNILNDDQDFQPSSFPASFSIPLNANGGAPPYTWSLINAATTLPNPTLTGTHPNVFLNFTLTNFGSFAAGLNVVDGVGNSASVVVLYTVLSSVLFALVDGQLEVLITVPDTGIGTHHFTARVQDSTPAQVTGTFYYTALESYSEVLIPEAFFDHYWGANDATAVVFPIQGLSALQGYSLGAPVIAQPENGLVATVDNVNNVVKVAGPPTVFRSAEARIPFQVLLGNTQVALISREYTLLAKSGTTDIGTVRVFPHPFIVGDLVGLNPQKPWFNSPSIQKNVNYTARVQAGSSLPPGLSLDANTSLIYGNVIGVVPSESIIEYTDAQGIVHGTVSISWTLLNSQFTLINNLAAAQVQQPFTSGNTIGSNSTVPLQSVAIIAGVLPTGLSANLDSFGQSVVISGTPLEAGYFDIWFAVTNTSNQAAYLYVRFVCDFILPLTVLTSSLPNFSNQPYSIELQGFGGIQPYAWSLDPDSPALPGGILLSSAGVLSGTYANSPTAYNQNIIVDLVDAETPALSTTAILNLTYNNTLVVTTPAIPILVPGQPYSFAMQAIGGIPPYTWTISPPVNGLVAPTGITFGTNGVFSGATDQTSLSETVTITVTDSAAATAFQLYTLEIGPESGLVIDTADVLPINRGTPYQGHLSVAGPGTAPYAWQIPPSSPNALPTGLSVIADANTVGVTATISGTYSGPVLVNFPVEVEVVDANGQSAFVYMLMSTSSNVTITTVSLPAGEISGFYGPVQLTAIGGVPPYTFALDPGSPLLPSGFTLTSGGVLSGTTLTAYNQNVTFVASDSLTPANTGKKTFNLLVQATNLAITNVSLPGVTAGIAYSVTLTATEIPLNTPFTWSISPSSAASLPTGITLNSASGVISGATQIIGSRSVTFRVTDKFGAFAEKTFTLNVASGLTIHAGPSFADSVQPWAANTAYLLGDIVIDTNGNVQKVTTAGTSGGTPPVFATFGTTADNTVTWTFVSPQYIGYIDNGSVTALFPRSNDSFSVVVSGVVSTSPNQLGVTVGSPSIGGITANVLNIVSGVALIQLVGPFAHGALGDNDISITLTDNGVQASATFKWKVFSSGALRLAPGSGTFPTQVINV